MFFNILIAILIFSYAGWAMYRFINKSRQGKCPSCDTNSKQSKTDCCSSVALKESQS